MDNNKNSYINLPFSVFGLLTITEGCVILNRVALDFQTVVQTFLCLLHWNHSLIIESETLYPQESYITQSS